MSTDTGAPQEPPFYDNETSNLANETIQPTTLVLAAQSIHADSIDLAPLCKAYRGIDSLTHSTPKVEFERVERTLKTSAEGKPSIKPRADHIYDLSYMKAAPGTFESLPSNSPHYFIQAVSRKSIVNVGIKKCRFRSHWIALPIDISGQNGDYGLPQFIKDTKSLFEIHHNGGRYEWADGDGNSVAVEEDEGEDQHRLVVTASLRRETMDALVALWCLSDLGVFCR